MGGGAAAWTTHLIEDCSLSICNNGEATYHKDHSSYLAAIDLTLAGPETTVSQ